MFVLSLRKLIRMLWIFRRMEFLMSGILLSLVTLRGIFWALKLFMIFSRAGE
ncbi:hypothetical protein ACS0TY_033994 [Phlomoides rotata]